MLMLPPPTVLDKYCLSNNLDTDGCIAAPSDPSAWQSLLCSIQNFSMLVSLT